MKTASRFGRLRVVLVGWGCVSLWHETFVQFFQFFEAFFFSYLLFTSCYWLVYYRLMITWTYNVSYGG